MKVGNRTISESKLNKVGRSLNINKIIRGAHPMTERKTLDVIMSKGFLDAEKAAHQFEHYLKNFKNALVWRDDTTVKYFNGEEHICTVTWMYFGLVLVKKNKGLDLFKVINHAMTILYNCDSDTPVVVPKQELRKVAIESKHDLVYVNVYGGENGTMQAKIEKDVGVSGDDEDEWV